MSARRRKGESAVVRKKTREVELLLLIGRESDLHAKAEMKKGMGTTCRSVLRREWIKAQVRGLGNMARAGEEKCAEWRRDRGRLSFPQSFKANFFYGGS